MNANEAANLSKKAMKTVIIEPLRKFIDAKIEEAANNGHRSIVHPMSGYDKRIDSDTEKALWLSLENDGFNVKHHPDPDPGHPCSSAYDEVSW